jgi:hypothetical protein
VNFALFSVILYQSNLKEFLSIIFVIKVVHNFMHFHATLVQLMSFIHGLHLIILVKLSNLTLVLLSLHVGNFLYSMKVNMFGRGNFALCRQLNIHSVGSNGKLNFICFHLTSSFRE